MQICVFDTVTNLIRAVEVPNLIPYGQTYPAAENLVSGALVTIFTDITNVTKVKNASANVLAGGLPCIGYVVNAVSSGAQATVTFEGPDVIQVVGFTINDIGKAAYLSNVAPGSILNAPPTVQGSIVQPVGFITGVVGNIVTLSFLPAFPNQSSEEIQTVTVNPTTLVLTRPYTFVKCQGGKTVNLPPASVALTNFKLTLKRIDNNGPVPINAVNPNTVDGFSGTPIYTLQTPRSVVNLYCDGTGWFITSAL
jgi:hypothetical protein